MSSVFTFVSNYLGAYRAADDGCNWAVAGAVAGTVAGVWRWSSSADFIWFLMTTSFAGYIRKMAYMGKLGDGLMDHKQPGGFRSMAGELTAERPKNWVRCIECKDAANRQDCVCKPQKNK